MIIKGKVIKGDQRGRKQGFPTANLNRNLAAKKISKGVYACLINIKSKWSEGILIYGAPDKNNGSKLEVFFLNFRRNVYHRVITVKIIQKIRPLINFKSKNKFLKQAKKDVKKARKILKPLKNSGLLLK